ncbi:MAG: hypothetical protein ACFFG0_28650 [Candidatus Thorarchaeota archaeon]
MLVPVTTKKIQIICPICKTRDLIGVPERELNNSSHLTTISIHKGLICPHHFQVFVDKNLQIRGYQKVDFELNQDNSKKLRNGVKAFNQNEKDCKGIFKDLITDNNNLKQQSVAYDKTEENKNLRQKTSVRIKRISLKDIYEEFWEFIDENNHRFREFIVSDKRRKNFSTNSNISEIRNQSELNQEIF